MASSAAAAEIGPDFRFTPRLQEPIPVRRDALRQVHVIATWQSEHLVELEDEDAVENLVELLQAQSNVKLVGYTAQPLDEAVDAAIDELLDR